jgi:RHS repeat-associated protein
MPRTSLFVAFPHLLGVLIIATSAGYLHVAQPFFNSAPTATADSYTLHGNGTIEPLLANDSDPDPGDTLSSTIVTFPTNGSLSDLGNSNYSYSRNSSTWTGVDSFTYKACDNQFPSLCSSPVTVTITVVNQAPVAVNDSYFVHGSAVIGPMKFNDTDPDGDALTFSIVTFPTNGTLTGVSVPPYTSDQKNYAPNYGYTGPDSFIYRVCDPFNACSTATAALTAWNSPPTPNADFYIVNAGSTTVIGPLRENDFDPDGDTFGSPSMHVPPSNGSITGTTNPDYKNYTPNVGFTGTDTYQYRITDSLGGWSTATVYILVLPAGLPPRVPYADCPSDPGCLTDFKPGSGGSAPTTGGPAGRSGPSWPDPVNLATGRETFAPPPDLQVYNPTGPSVVWGAHYFADQALKPVAGYASSGLTRGWVHNYDIRVEGTAGSWGALTLHYPNGANETLTPRLSGGTPTGAFTTVAGAPYFVTGISGSPTGTWQSVTVTWKDQIQWKFTQHSGATYALNQITNRTGQSLNFNWNSNRALTQVSDAGSSTVLLTLAYAGNGRLSTATDVYNRQVSYSFTAGSATTPSTLQSVSQVVTSGTTSPPARWTYSYTSDKGQQLSTITVPSPTGTGNSTATINYNSIGKVTSLVDANGNQRVYTHNAGNTLVQVKDAANNVALSWTQKFNANGLNTGFTDAATHSTTIAYTDANNPLKPTSFTDRNNHTKSYTYDSFGNVLTVTTPRGITTTYTWNYSNFSLGRLTSIQEGTKPAATISYYEPSGIINTISKPKPNNHIGTNTTIYTYDSLGNLLTVVTPGNDAATSITTTFNYTTDGTYSQPAKIGQPLTITDSLSHVTHVRYDSQGRTISVTDALGTQTSYTHNLAGQVLTTTFPATGQTGTGNNLQTNAYLYVGGPLTSETFYNESNTQVRQVTHTYGPEGEALTVAGSAEPVTITYDAFYRLKTLKDGNNNTTTYGYNNIGLLSSVTMPDSQVTQFTSYDDDGNLLQRIDANDVTTNYVYDDPESLLTDIEYPASTSLNVQFTYDSYGRRSGMNDSSGSHGYSYGNLNELLSVSTTYTGLSAKTISYSYYPNGSRESMATPAGPFYYSYDAAGRPSSMTNPFSEITSWSFQDNNWLQAQTLDNGATATYTYDALGQVTRLLNKIGSSTVSDFSSIAYDGVGNRSSVTASLPGATSLSGTTGYTYDSKNQLTQETSTRNGGFTDNFGYDSAGNPTNFKGVTKTYNSNNHEIGAGFNYDDNGNPTTYSGASLTFDPESRMTAYGTAMSAGYTGDSIRAWKENSSGRTYFLYDGVSPIIELNGSGAVSATNTFGLNGLVSRRSGSNSTFYSFDSEGNVVHRSDGSGAVLTNYLFSGYGTVVSGTLGEPFGYRGQAGYYSDSETGLIMLTFRYYNPETGRFLTRDPIGYEGGINIYAYVTNNPINLQDMLGLDGDDEEPGFLSLMGSYGKGVVKGIVGGAVGTIKLPIDLIRNPADTVSGIAGDLGMRAKTFVDIAADPSGAGDAIIDAIITLGPNNSMEILGGAGGNVIVARLGSQGGTYVGNMARYGREIKIGSNCRIAPFGNRTGHPTGKYPHYHRGVPDPNSPGHSLPGQSKKRHRPWDTKSTDRSWRDRF